MVLGGYHYRPHAGIQGKLCDSGGIPVMRIEPVRHLRVQIGIDACVGLYLLGVPAGNRLAIPNSPRL